MAISFLNCCYVCFAHLKFYLLFYIGVNLIWHPEEEDRSRLLVLGNKVLNRLHGPKREEVI
jgi:hypothetical protein